MSTLQLQLSRHENKQENLTYCQEQRKAVKKEKDGEIIQLSELTNKDVKAATINILKDLMENMITWGNLHRYVEMLLKKSKILKLKGMLF